MNTACLSSTVWFDLIQRYRMSSGLIEAVRSRRPLRILDAGSQVGHLKSFLPEDIVINLDIERLPGKRHLAGDVLEMPFPSKGLDFALSLDVLEHIEPASRRTFFTELARVSQDCFLIGAPFLDPEVEDAEQKVNEFFLHVTGADNQFLSDHFDFGLPDLDEVLEWAGKAGYQAVVLPNNYLPRWTLMMCLNACLSGLPKTEDLINTVNSLYIRQFGEFDNSSPAYRHLILFSKLKNLREEVIQRQFISPPTPPDFMKQQWDFLNLLFKTIVTRQERLYFELLHQLEIENDRYDTVRVELDYIKSTFGYRLFKNTWGRLRDRLKQSSTDI